MSAAAIASAPAADIVKDADAAVDVLKGIRAENGIWVTAPVVTLRFQISPLEA